MQTENYFSFNLHLPINLKEIKAFVSRYINIRNALILHFFFFGQPSNNNLKTTEISLPIPVSEKIINKNQNDKSKCSTRVKKKYQKKKCF